jgi:ribosomal protein L11 methyltransferase
LIRLALRVRRADAELALAELLELVPEGLEEVDRGDEVEFAIYGAPGELPELPELRAHVGGALASISTTELADDWAERWRSFHRPLVLDRLVVRPPWLASPVAARPEVVIEPGRAFGTGAHATTRLALELLLELEPGGGLLDIGCGSGVLAIAAARLGFAPVCAVDHDVDSVEITRANALANGVALNALRVDLRRERLPGAPTVLANLVRPLLLSLAERPPEPMPEVLIVSGLLGEECDEVARAFAPSGLRERDRRQLAGWSALRLQQ